MHTVDKGIYWQVTNKYLQKKMADYWFLDKEGQKLLEAQGTAWDSRDPPGTL